MAVALALAWHRQWQWRNSNSKTSYISSIILLFVSVINITLRSVIYVMYCSVFVMELSCHI